MQLIECVPNFSEGCDAEVIKKITDVIVEVEGVSLLNVDPGKATNRTVVTFAGKPEAVIEAAFRAIKTAGELINMANHTGEHPRMGATDVCPLIPISGISIDEVAEYAQRLAKKVGEELQIPVYLYEEAQPDKSRSNLSIIRAGEYEGFFDKIKQPEWKPDFGPDVFDAKRGATVIGARDFLIAYNINLNTTSVRRANAVAFDVREAGRALTKNGKKILDEQGNSVQISGSLKHVKAIGWYIEEYGIAQISMNLTNINVTPLHVAFDEVCKKADERGLRVTGSELVGMVPLTAIVEAGKYFLKKQKRSVGIPKEDIIKIAVKSLGLDELQPFNPTEKIIEYKLKSNQAKLLVDKTVAAFADETSCESPAPGGGSISALAGALGVSLATMVANLSAHKRGWDDRWEFFSNWAEKGEKLKIELLQLVDEDTNAFNNIMQAMSMPQKSDEEKQLRKAAIEAATIYAIHIPFTVMQKSSDSLAIIAAMVAEGNPNSITDAGVGALCAKAAVQGAYMNVKINAVDYKNTEAVQQILVQVENLLKAAVATADGIVEMVNGKIA